MLEITLFGNVTVHMHGQLINGFRSQKELALLAYLAHTGQTHSREALADLLWEARSTKQSLSNLRTALARLRKQVGEQLIVTRKTVAISPTVHEQTDTARFLALLAGAGVERSATAANLLAQGLELYRGEFMAGFSLPEAPRFTDWLVVEQEHLRQAAMRGFRQLAGWQEEAGVFSAGIATAQKWAAWDPLDETAVQQLMRLLAYDGRGAEALRVYEKSRHLLQVELGVPPAPATTALYEAIQEGSLQAPDIAAAPLHNLPRSLAPLFGREEELRRLASLLVDPAYPLVSVTGPGGMGKTSLALAAGRALLAGETQHFRDGIWFVALEDIEHDEASKVRDRVAALMGQAVGLTFHGESDLWRQLLGQLAAKNLLLILDNIEQFLPVASDLIVELLETSADIHLLVTSRTSPALAASVALPLQGLEIPALLSPQALENESVRLFAERAARLPAPFDLQEDLAKVVAICRFVEGMPLGIELAAASLGRLMIGEILPALNGSLHLLESDRGDLPPRQRTLQAVFEHSWGLLDAHEQSLLAQISVFRGGFTRQAAGTVLQDATSGLYNLQYHALLRRDEKGRFHMHPLLRQLAGEKLGDPATSELAAQAADRHSSYFAGFLESFAADLQRGAGQEVLQTILRDQANLRAAWGHAAQVGQWGAIAGCLDGAHYFYQRMGLFGDEAALVDGAITAVRTAMEPGDLFLAALLSRLLTVRARDYMNSAQFAEGIEAAEEACALADRLGDKNLEGQARLARARIHSTQHKREAALGGFEKVVVLAKGAQNQFLEADGWIGVGGQLIWQEDVSKMQEALYHALDLCRTLRYQSGEMETLHYLGTLETRREAFAAAGGYHKQALTLSRLLGDVAAEAEELGSLGVVLNLQGDLPGSQIYQQEALATFRRLNMTESEAWMLGELGYTALRLGDFGGGEKQLAEALVLSTGLEDVFWQAWVRLRLGTMWQERGDFERGLALILEAYQTAEQFNYINFKAAVLYEWGNTLLSSEDWATAEQKYQGAYDLRQGSGRREQALPSLAGLAYVTFQQDRPKTAAAHAEQLWQTWQESPAMAGRAHLKLYWMLGVVWDGLGDSRAQDLWTMANALLQERCEKIPDERARKMFLEGVSVHRAIMTAS